MLFAVVVMAAVGFLGDEINSVFGKIKDGLAGADSEGTGYFYF